MITLRSGDCKEVLLNLEVGAVICDPPYGLEFMGKGWDRLDGVGSGMQSWHLEWLPVVFESLRPGGVIKAFGGTRTFHRLAAAMEAAGFTDIHLEAWGYGSGFPKSMDVSKQLDKAAGATREVVGSRSKHHDGSTRTGTGRSDNAIYGALPDIGDSVPVSMPATEAARQWDGWGTALKPAWEPVVVGRKPQ